jgi:occludin/MAL family lipid-associated protein
MPRDYWKMDGAFSLPVRATVRTLIFVFSIVEIGLFAADISHLPDSVTPTNQIVGLVVAVLSVLTCGYHCLATVSSGAWYAWDFVLGVMWAAMAGVFGSLAFNKLGKDDEFGPVDGARRARLTAAVVFALACMLLNVASTIFGCAWCCAARKERGRQSNAKEEYNLEANVAGGQRSDGGRA